MSRKIFLAAFLVIVMVLGVLGSGCLSGNSEKIKVDSGEIAVSSGQAITVEPGSGDVTVDGVKQGTWLCVGEDNGKMVTLTAAIDIANPKAVSDLDLSAKFPNGKEAYAKNFKLIKRTDGQWAIQADHKGINQYAVYYVSARQNDQFFFPLPLTWSSGPILLGSQEPNDEPLEIILVATQPSSGSADE